MDSLHLAFAGHLWSLPLLRPLFLTLPISISSLTHIIQVKAPELATHPPFNSTLCFVNRGNQPMNLRTFIWVVQCLSFRDFYSRLDRGLRNHPALSYRHLGTFSGLPPFRCCCWKIGRRFSLWIRQRLWHVISILYISLCWWFLIISAYLVMFAFDHVLCALFAPFCKAHCNPAASMLCEHG